MTNIVIASGLVKGKFEAYSNDGIRFELSVTSGSGNNAKAEVYTVVAYSAAAEKLKTDVESGNRLVFVGRIASEKFEDTKVFHNVLNLSKILAVTEAQYGSDYIVAVVSGIASSQELKYTPNGAPVVNVNLASSRSYEDKKTKEMKEYITYLDGTVWNALAEASSAADILPMKDTGILLVGTPKPNTFKNKEGIQVNRLNVWALDLFTGTQIEGVDAPKSNAEKPAQASPKPATASKFGGNKNRKDVFGDD